MRILLIRHGEPDYEHDSLTPKGDREAKLLSDLLARDHIDHIYKSPLGRARRTASFTEEKLGMEGETLDWLQEFPGTLDINGYPELQKAYPDTPRNSDGTYEKRIFWDMLPSYLTAGGPYLDNSAWADSEEAVRGHLKENYERVTGGFDDLLASYGYRRNGLLYRVERESKETIALFCHMGVSCVLLSHLWNCSPYIPWHSVCMLPSAVTEIVSEEREQGVAYFRTLRIGDISHLVLGNEPPSFMARFCETYEEEDVRH